MLWQIVTAPLLFSLRALNEPLFLKHKIQENCCVGWAGEMAQLVEYLPCMYKDLGSNPQSPCKSQAQ